MSDAAAAVEVNDGHGESSSRDDDRGRVTDGIVEDSDRRVAQMFVSICSAGAASSSGTCVADSAVSGGCAPSPVSPPPNNAVSGLADHGHICFSSETIPSNDTDVLSTFGDVSPHNEAHLERSDEEVDNASSLLLGNGSFHRRVGVEISGASDNLADVVHDGISNKNMSTDFDGVVRLLDQQYGGLDEVSLQPNTPSENDGFNRPPSSTAVSDSMAVDPYETICDDLLESVDASISESMCQTAAPCSTDVCCQPDAESSESSGELSPTNDATLTTAVLAGSSGVELAQTSSGVSTVNGGSASSSTTVTCRPQATTLRRARTNFAVVYRQTTSQPTVPDQSRKSSTNIGRVETKAVSDRVERQQVPVGCRRELAFLASRLDDRSRRRLAETNVDGRAVSRPSFQSPAVVNRDPSLLAAPPAVSLTSKIRPVASSAAAAGHNDATMAWNHHLGQSSSVDDHVTPGRADSKLPISTSAPTHSSVFKKPSTFRKLLSSKLTNAVRRTHTKHN